MTPTRIDTDPQTEVALDVPRTMAVLPAIADQAARVPAAGARAEAPPACCRRPARQRLQVRTAAHSGAALDALALATARGLARSRCDVLEPASVDKFAERLAVEVSRR